MVPGMLITSASLTKDDDYIAIIRKISNTRIDVIRIRTQELGVGGSGWIANNSEVIEVPFSKLTNEEIKLYTELVNEHSIPDRS